MMLQRENLAVNFPHRFDMESRYAQSLMIRDSFAFTQRAPRSRPITGLQGTVVVASLSK